MRPVLGCALCLVSMVGMDACHSAHPPAAETAYEQIHAAFLEGANLDQSAREADAASREYSGRGAEWSWKFRLLEADILIHQGASPQVITLLDSGPPAPPAAGELAVERSMFLALAYSHTGRFMEADRAYRQASVLCGAQACSAAGELARIGGSIEIDKNELVEAQSFFTSSLQIARRRSDRYLELSNLSNLGLVAMLEQHYDESIDWFSQARTMSGQLHAGIGEEKALGNLGWDYYKMGDFDKSLDLSRQAIEKARERGISIDEIEWLNNVETVSLKRGEFELAEHNYRRSLELARKSQNRRQEIDALCGLAYIFVRTGRIEEASVYIGPAIELAKQSGDHSEEAYPLLLRGQLLARQSDTPAAERIFKDIAAYPHNDASLRWEAEEELAGLYAGERQWRQAEVQYRNALNTVDSARCDIRHEELRMPFLANAGRLYDDFIDFLVEQGRSMEALKVADEGRALTLAEGLGMGGRMCLAAEAVFAPLRIARQTNATVLFYWLGEKHSYLWAVAPDRMKLYSLPPAGEIEPAIEAYRKALVAPRDALESADANGGKLYQTLVAPAAEFFHPGGRVIVIADGSLSGLSFESLIAPQPRPHYWIEDVTLENASSLRLLAVAAPPRRGSAGGKLLLMGDPVTPREGEFDALPNAANEMRNVGKYFAPADEQIYRRSGSTPSAYLGSHPEQFAYIHFVAHGAASLSDPLDSAVVLSPSAATPAGSDQSYKLYARDIITHPLRAELVTISTCKGMGVRAYAGEGVVGLSWAFLHAGAHQVIGALWDVSDSSTPQLMDAMYAGLAKGNAPDAALRAAKLSLLHSETPFRKPYYWAAFQLYTGS